MTSIYTYNKRIGSERKRIADKVHFFVRLVNVHFINMRIEMIVYTVTETFHSEN